MALGQVVEEFVVVFALAVGRLAGVFVGRFRANRSYVLLKLALGHSVELFVGWFFEGARTLGFLPWR